MLAYVTACRAHYGVTCWATAYEPEFSTGEECSKGEECNTGEEPWEQAQTPRGQEQSLGTCAMELETQAGGSSWSVLELLH